MTDDPTKPVTVNQALADFLGYRKEELELKPLLATVEMVTHPEDLDDETKSVERLMSGEIQQYRMEKRYVRKDGEVVWGDLTTVCLRDELDGFILAMSAVIDITASKRLEAQLRQAEKMSAVGRLAGGMAHHFNNTLTSIIGNTTFALKECPPHSRAREDMNAVLQTSQHAAELVRRLMILTKQQMVNPTTIHLNELLLDLYSTVCGLIPENIELVVVPGAKISRVEADPLEIERALVNLVMNACDAISGEGTITIESASVIVDDEDARVPARILPGAYCVLKVHDNGCGMSDEVKKHLFEPFFTTKRAGEVMGLGLATVYGVMQQHEGYVHVESHTGHGTHVELYFPVVDD